MREWLFVLVIAVGCTGPAATCPPPVAARSFAGVTMPPVTPWDGQTLPQSSADTAVVLWKSNAGWFAFGADPVAGTIPWVLSVKDDQMAAFLTTVTGATKPYGGVRPPPSGNCPPSCGQPEVELVLKTAARISGP